jgi:sterol desaturase/sphingolipid hydroxylase (fatty acid hydroxylase superfamily)
MLAEHRAPDRAADTGDRRLLVNFGLGALGALIASLPWISAFGAAAWSRDRGWGLTAVVDLPIPVEAVLIFVMISLQSYWSHRLLHRVDWLWWLHRVHHNDASVDLSTSFRGHPLEYAIDALLRAAVVAVLAPGVTALVAALLVQQIMTVMTHANVRLPEQVSRTLGTVLTTPALHLRHHASDRREHDSNFGNVVIVWDRLFGTFSANPPQSPLGLESSRG